MSRRTRTAVCRNCGRPMLRVLSISTGGPMMLDPEPAPNGNVLLDGNERAHVFADHDAAMAARAADIARGGLKGITGQAHLSHHATCPPLVERAERRRREREAQKAAEAEAERLRLGGEQIGLGL